MRVVADHAAMAAALARNLWRGTPPPDGADAMLARMVFAQSSALSQQTLSALAGGEVRFLPAEEASR